MVFLTAVTHGKTQLTTEALIPANGSGVDDGVVGDHRAPKPDDGSGNMSPAEYQRMVAEKAAAMQLSALAVMGGRGKKQVLAPWHKRATANAKRLRLKR